MCKVYSLILLFFLLMTGCAGNFENKGPRGMMRQGMGEGGESGVRIFNAPYRNVFKAVERSITGKKYQIRVCDERGGIINSDYRIHDGDFTLGFVGAKLRSKMVARLAELSPKQIKVTLTVLAEKEYEDGEWENFPVSAFNLDLIDSDSYDMYFYNISENLKSTQPG